VTRIQLLAPSTRPVEHRTVSKMPAHNAGTHGNTGGPLDWFNDLPKLSRSFAAVLLFSAACISYGVSFIKYALLDWRQVTRGLQVCPCWLLRVGNRDSVFVPCFEALTSRVAVCRIACTIAGLWHWVTAAC
jgi:hypothetical protein